MQRIAVHRTMLVATRTSRMCSLCGVGAHAPPGCLSKTGTKAMGVKAAARVVNGALTTMPPQQWQRWRCTRAQRRSLCLMQRRASRPRCPDCHWGARAAVCGKAQYRGPRCRGHGRLGERAGGLSGPQLHTRTVCVLTIAYLCPCGTPACPDAAARASARGVSRGTLFHGLTAAPHHRSAVWRSGLLTTSRRLLGLLLARLRAAPPPSPRVAVCSCSPS